MSVGHSVTAVFNGVLHPFLSIPEVTPLTRLHAPATHLIAHKGLKTLTSYKLPVYATMWLRRGRRWTRLRHFVATTVTFTGYKLRFTSF